MWCCEHAEGDRLRLVRFTGKKRSDRRGNCHSSWVIYYLIYAREYIVKRFVIPYIIILNFTMISIRHVGIFFLMIIATREQLIVTLQEIPSDGWSLYIGHRQCGFDHQISRLCHLAILEVVDHVALKI